MSRGLQGGRFQGDPDGPYSGELMGQRNGKSERKDFRTPSGKESGGNERQEGGFRSCTE